MKQPKNKKVNTKLKTKISIAVCIILLLLIFLFANRSKVLKPNQIGTSEYTVVTINDIDISNVVSATPNEPKLGAGMIPIKWNEEQQKWQITAKDNSDKWYDYSKGLCANVMLSDGVYQSEVLPNMTGKRLADENTLVSEEELGTIFTWVPRLMYNDTQIEYLKGTCMVEYNWTTPSCFTYAKQGINEYDLAFTGMWVAKKANTNIENTEDNIYGIIKNEIVSTITDEERLVLGKLNEKIGNVENETIISNLEEVRQTIKILKTNVYAKMTTQHKVASDIIELKTIYKENDIRYVLDKNGNVLSTDTSGNVSCDILEDNDDDEYIFYVVDKQGNVKKHRLLYAPVGKPYLKGFNPNTTFYVTYDAEGNEESIVPIGEKAPQGWYSYENQMWANIVVRNNGDEAYFVWIPRYMYKLNTTTQRSEVKFVDTENNYTDQDTGKVVSLNNSEYTLPDAFTWNETPLRGYWISKYELADTSTYKPEIKGGSGVIRIKNVVEQFGTSYTYEAYLIKDGKRIMWSDEAGAYVEGTTPVPITGNYTFTNVEPGTYAVNIVLKDSSKKHVRAVSNEVTVTAPAKPETPDLTGFNPNTTFYVTYDAAGNEESVVPIGEEPPQGWYDYDNQVWANIVVRGNNQEAYFVWIPRYEYSLDSVHQRSNVIFIPKTKIDPDNGYTIPDAFTWNGEPLKGYWMSKYELGEGSSPLTLAVAGGLDKIRVSNIANKSGKTISSYEAYLIKDGVRVEGPVTVSSEYTFTGLEYGTYSVHLIGKDSSGKQVISTAKEVKLQELEPPTLVGFMVDKTYIVTYDSAGNAQETQTLRSVLKDGAEISENGALISGEVDLSKIEAGRTWYDYSKQIWPNIVTKNNNKVAYFVWIQRYKYGLDSSNQRSNVVLIPKTETEADTGYTIPEAFTWNGEPIAGYWISKYELGT